MKLRKQTALATAAALFLAPGLATAQQAAPKAGSGPSAETQAMIKDYRSTAKELQQIQEKAVEANPSLKEKRENLQGKMQTAMADSGYDVESNRERLKAIGKKLKSGDVEKGKRQELMKELRSKQQEMRKAQQAAMQKPDVQAARQELQKKTLAAMREQSDKTDKLLKEMKQKRAKLQAMQKSGGGGPAPAGGAPAPGGGQ